MNNNIYERVIEEANYILSSNCTIREAAYLFGVSKSTVHKDIRDRLYDIDVNMYNMVSNILEEHAYIKHIRGGESTKRKFLGKKHKL